jgi:hypothetical protein
VGVYAPLRGSGNCHFNGMLDELAIFDSGLSPQQVRQLYRDGIRVGDLYVDVAHSNDLNDGLSPQTALATIQKAIDEAKDGGVVNVYPGVYREQVQFQGKAITVQSIGDAAVIEAPGGSGVSFCMGEGLRSILRNVVIRNCHIGIICDNSSPAITNVTVAGNVRGVEGRGYSATALPYISNSIIWGNSESDLHGLMSRFCCVGLAVADANDWLFDPGRFPTRFGTFSLDPSFVDPKNGDYHLRSARGRYWPEHDV